MSTMMFRLECPCPLIIIPIVEGCLHEEEVEDLVVEGLIELIEVEECHEEGSEVVEVELLLKLCHEGHCIMDWLFVCFVTLSEFGCGRRFLVSLVRVRRLRRLPGLTFMSMWDRPSNKGHCCLFFLATL